MTQLLAPEHPPKIEPALRGDVIIPSAVFDPPDDATLRRLSVENTGWKFEIGCDGELVINMHSGGDSGDISGEFGRQIGNWWVTGGGGTGTRGRLRGSQSGYWLGGGTQRPPLKQPDVSWVSPEQYAALSAEEALGAYPVCPPFLVEVRSLSDSLKHQQEKMELWLRFGMKLGWLIDPFEETAWIYRTDQEPERLERPDTLSGENVLEGLTVDMAEIWALVDETKSKSDSE